MTTNFGKDTSCTDSMRTGRYATGARLVAEALYRRFTTPRGTLRGGEEEADYGFDLLDLIGTVTTDADAAALEGRLRVEALKDERVQKVDASVVISRAGAVTQFTVSIEATTAVGPFKLQLAVSDVSVELLGIEA